MPPVLSSLSLQLLIGSLIPVPAPESLTRALTGVTVTCGTNAPSGFQLTFHAERFGSGRDEPLLATGLLKPHDRVILVVTINGTPRVLMDGFVTRQEYTPGGRQGSTLVVTGEDVSLKMDMFEIPFQWPFMMDFLIAAAVLAKYLVLGIVPIVIPTINSLVPMDHVPAQNSSDRKYLHQLAGQNGCLFYIEPGPLVGMNRAYWGPPVRIGAPQKALSVDLGPFSNVDSISFSYDGTAPTTTYGAVGQWPLPVPIPVAIAATTRLPALAASPALGNYLGLVSNPLSFLTDLFTLKVRGSLFQHQARNVIEAYALAQLGTDTSVDQVVTVQGSLDTVRYGDILRAPGLVAVRGAGISYDGLYLVDQVTHKISTRMNAWEYKQDFNLTREGLGTTVQGVAS